MFRISLPGFVGTLGPSGFRYTFISDLWYGCFAKMLHSVGASSIIEHFGLMGRRPVGRLYYSFQDQLSRHAKARLNIYLKFLFAGI
jgi:hypothetical protein